MPITMLPNKAARRAARRFRGTPAWDKDRTRKLFAQYQETHDSG